MTRARAKALHDKVRGASRPRRGDTPWSREGEEQLAEKMKLDPMKKEKKGFSQAFTQTGLPASSPPAVPAPACPALPCSPRTACTPDCRPPPARPAPPNEDVEKTTTGTAGPGSAALPATRHCRPILTGTAGPAPVDLISTVDFTSMDQDNLCNADFTPVRIWTYKYLTPSSRLGNGDETRDGEVLRNTERLATQHNLWTQRQEFKEQLSLFETRIDEQYEEVAHNFSTVNQDLALLREATDNLNGQMAANDANMERRMDNLERAITNLGPPPQGMKTILVLIDHMLVKKTLALTQGEVNSIAMLVLMNDLHKNKFLTKIVIKRLAMPTMGVTTNPTTTSSTTWRHMVMLPPKVVKSNQGVISAIILAMTNVEEETHNMIKTRGPSLDIANNLAKTLNNILHVNQVKQVFNSTANPMLWLDVKDLLYHLKPQEMKATGEDDAEAYLSWALKVDKIFRIHNYSGAKKVAMASLEFEDYANTWWEQVLTLREEKGEPPIDTWEEMKEEMHARFVPTHYETDLFNKLQKLKQGTKTVEEFFKEMELTMMRANIQESEQQTIARFFNGLNYPIKRIVEFQPYSNMVELVHQASKAERQVNEDLKYSKSKSYFASKFATTTPPSTSVKPTASSTTSKQPTIQSRMKQTVSSTASSKASTGPSNVTCFKCGTQGHKSFECKNTKVMITMENGDIETLSEGEYEALVQAAVANEEDYDEESGEDPLLCTHDPSPSLVVTRVLTTQPQAMEDQRCNIFQTRAGIGGKSIKVIIDGGSCHNLASTELCEKLNLTLRKHPHPYHVQWLSDKGNVKIQHTVTVNFKIGPYEDTVECDVVPMTVCHMLLGRPWQFDKKAIHDGYSNAYTFKVKDKKFELRPMTPSQIIADNAKALARAQHHIHHSELRGEGATHQKESERHHPHMSERKSVLLATKSEWREVKDNPSTTIHYVLICKGLSSETNDLTNIPSSLLSLLKEFQDVFPDELPHGLPPLRGIEHRIDLIPGAPLPNRAAYRTNPEDTKEIQRQIQDLLAKGKNLEDHVQHVREVLCILRHEKLFANLPKCHLLKTNWFFLAIHNWPTPTNVGQVRSFHGLAGFYRRFVKDFSTIACPLNELTKKNVPFVWGKAQQKAFDELKKRLTEAPLLALPDFAKTFEIECDASGLGIGGVLMQNGKPVAYYSEKLDGARLNYPIYDKELYALCSVDRGFDDFYLHDGYLFKANKICIPESSLRKLLLQESHGGGLMGHFGREKTYAMLSTHYYWPRMYRDVERLCRRCTTCLQAKEVVRLHGIPASIVSDRDVKFMSYLWKSLMAKFGVKLLFSSSSHPQTDGQTEVVNRSLSTLLRTLVKTNLKSWEDCLPHAEFAYNRAKHSTTSRSPFMIVYGFEPPTALDILPLPLHERTNMDFDERTTAMKKLHEETRATIQEHVLRQANRLNAKKKERVFEEGDLVWIHLRKERFPQERNSKLKPRGDGPFKVLKRINNNAYVIDIPTSKYVEHQDPGEEGTPWSREGEEQLAEKMPQKLDPMLYKKEGEEGLQPEAFTQDRHCRPRRPGTAGRSGTHCRPAHPGTAGLYTPALPAPSALHGRPHRMKTWRRLRPALPAQAQRHCRPPGTAGQSSPALPAPPLLT
ncbi:hypothetical protein QYE76_042902 [Lolium multiflorum]|uniref:Uncharacterized protein n=1 Tax=Lolium multiflorum TaxID=4521 RepID=A0AAD8WVK4_LOLMU|nr:hypothetical protein QYE76_042902 [Lolium multiflorum]